MFNDYMEGPGSVTIKYSSLSQVPKGRENPSTNRSYKNAMNRNGCNQNRNFALKTKLEITKIFCSIFRKMVFVMRMPKSLVDLSCSKKEQYYYF